MRRYKDDGLETWMVAYNTAWTIMSPVEVQRIVSSLLGPDHRHVDHVGVCAGDPPGDATIFVIRVAAAPDRDPNIPARRPRR